ncbi:DNA-directed RNA polymerase subunit alpha C-terminal domain-containing protein [Sporosarcina cyprini]|uniref:DNA-directed RNA polymerase subunit alpha C-terminal domain-containing protein n=1 Tax=Sporosarcina cyprini TaxID=2910523 RepID=UPI001EDE432C|nr:DNA-directed RNA polymerase subunit alpha C-terminal domain-containing protein [Sporosarcina cyprini]MCG3089284.1 DNA-binding protein [Sporosarcina cyprini]
MTHFNDFPKGLSKPALRALEGAGYTDINQLVGVTETELAALHGMGPKSIEIIKSALKEKGSSFKSE